MYVNKNIKKKKCCTSVLNILPKTFRQGSGCGHHRPGYPEADHSQCPEACGRLIPPFLPLHGPSTACAQPPKGVPTRR